MWQTICLILALTTVGLVIIRQLAIKYYHKRNTHSDNIKGKLVVVTGATSGVGLETVIDCFLRGATVVFLGRRAQLVKERIIPNLIARVKLSQPSKYLNAEELTQDVTDLEKGMFDLDGNFSSKRLMYRKCDLADLVQVKAFADYVISLHRPVKLIFNNAGSVYGNYTTTAQGIEMTTGVNILSHYYLVELLMTHLDKEARIVCVSSILCLFVGNKIGKLDIDRVLNPSKEGYFNWAQYSYSKLGVNLLAAGLQKILDKKKINAKSVSLHPGVIMSGFICTMHPIIYYSYLAFLPIPWSFMKTCEEGAQTSLHCALMPFAELEGGAYYSDCSKASHNKSITDENIAEFMKRSETIVNKAIKGKIENLVY